MIRRGFVPVATLTATLAIACQREPLPLASRDANDASHNAHELSLDVDADSLALEDTDAFKQCVANTSAESGWAGDSIVILDLNTSVDDAVAIVEANQHHVVDRLEAIHILNIEVGSPGVVFEWVCRYRLDARYAPTIQDAWANHVSSLSGEERR